jgi:serine/threonine protein kinase
MIESEIDILKICDHPNIIGYKGHSETDKEIFIILELFKAIPLNTYLEQKCGSTPRREFKNIIKLKEEE